MARQPRFWVTVQNEPYPSGSTVRYDMGHRPIDGEYFIEGRLTQSSSVFLSLSDSNGSIVPSSFSFDGRDDDRWMRMLLEDDSYGWLHNREVTAYIESDQALTAGDDPMVVYRGVISAVKLASRMGFSIQSRDWVGSKRSPFNPDRALMLRKLTRGLFSQLPEELIGKPQDIIVGEISDNNSKNIYGELVPKGRFIPRWVGTKTIVDDGSPPPTTYTKVYLDPPKLFSATVHGTPGTRTCTYGVTFVTRTGQTVLSNLITVTNCPTTFTLTDYVRLNWGFAPGSNSAQYWDQIIASIPYVADGSGTPTNRLDTMNDGGNWRTWEEQNQTEDFYNDDGDDSHHKSPAPPTRNTALVDQRTDSGANISEWDIYFMAGHAINPDHVYGRFWPAWTTGGSYFREEIPAGGYGGDILFPGETGWPHADPYVDLVDSDTGLTHRCTVFYARGPRSLAHKNGDEYFAFNTTGLEDVGDGSGVPIRRAGFALQHLLSEFVLGNSGKGYYTGAWGGTPTFSDGSHMIDTGSVQTWQDVTEEWMGTTLGYTMDRWFSEEMTVGELLQAFNNSYNAKTGFDPRGRMFLDCWNFAADVTAAAVYRQHIEIIDMFPPEPMESEMANRFLGSWDWDNVNNEFSRSNTIVESTDSQNGYKETIELEWPLLLVRESAVALDVLGRIRDLRQWRPTYINLVVGMGACQHRPGDVIAVSHARGTGASGYVDRYFKIMSMELMPRIGRYTLHCMDISRWLNAVFAPAGLEDETTMTGNLGDETSPLPPPTGAYTLV